MKRTALILIFTAFAAVQLRAQTVTPPSPAIPPGAVSPIISVSDVAGSLAVTGSTGSLTPVPVITVPQVAGSLALTGSALTSQVVTNVGLNDLAPLLLNVESNLLETLPVLASFNDGFNFVSLSSGAQSPGATSTAVPGTILNNIPTSSSVMLPNSTNILGLPPGLAGIGTTNGTRTIVLTRDTLRALVVLENDIERMLPILDAVNGGTNFIVVTNK